MYVPYNVVPYKTKKGEPPNQKTSHAKNHDNNRRITFDFEEKQSWRGIWEWGNAEVPAREQH